MADETVQKWLLIVRAAWESDSFRQMLLANPVGVLQAAGMDPGVANVQIHEDSATTRHFVLPLKPGDVSIDEAHTALLSDANPGF